MATEKMKDETMGSRITSAIKSFVDLINNFKPERIQRHLVDPDQVEERLTKLKHWTPTAVTCEFRFERFAETVGFWNALAAICAALDHYPRVVIEVDRVQIFVTTPGVGLTEADFALIQRIEELA